MKNLLTTLFLLGVLTCGAQHSAGTSSDEEAIRKVIQTSYVEGLQNEGDTVKINSGFHPSFEMLIPAKDGSLQKYGLAAWKAKIRENVADGRLPRKKGEEISVKFLEVDVTGTAATAKFEFYVGGKLTFVDYMFLYRFSDGWKIVSKIYYKF